MKTAEEWIKQNGWLPWSGGDYETIKQIQLDAYRSGMTEAAEIAKREGTKRTQECGNPHSMSDSYRALGQLDAAVLIFNARDSKIL